VADDIPFSGLLVALLAVAGVLLVALALLDPLGRRRRRRNAARILKKWDEGPPAGPIVKHKTWTSRAGRIWARSRREP
jgi:hypothetical protein